MHYKLFGFLVKILLRTFVFRCVSVFMRRGHCFGLFVIFFPRPAVSIARIFLSIVFVVGLLLFRRDADCTFECFLQHQQRCTIATVANGHFLHSLLSARHHFFFSLRAYIPPFLLTTPTVHARHRYTDQTKRNNNFAVIFLIFFFIPAMLCRSFAHIQNTHARCPLHIERKRKTFNWFSWVHYYY